MLVEGKTSPKYQVLKTKDIILHMIHIEKLSNFEFCCDVDK
jgi:hypothetical protein